MACIVNMETWSTPPTERSNDLLHGKCSMIGKGSWQQSTHHEGGGTEHESRKYGDTVSRDYNTQVPQMSRTVPKALSR